VRARDLRQWRLDSEALPQERVAAQPLATDAFGNRVVDSRGYEFPKSFLPRPIGVAADLGEERLRGKQPGRRAPVRSWRGSSTTATSQAGCKVLREAD